MRKRLFDIIISFISLILLLPIMLIIALLIRVFQGNQILFRQQRPGLNSVVFTMHKFCTMRNAHHQGKLLPDSDRLTPLGKILRKTSLDELPSLWSVLKGDMSLIGPRPLLVEYLPLYSTEQARRHDVKPGITGWAQINGRNALSWNEKFKLDVWYVDNHNFWLDIKILFLTVKKVINQDDINAEGEATMSKFTGNHDEQAQ
jgi:lipopolysaccharide/colanic/teichoic acid biosynthesis glycosyltransferase